MENAGNDKEREDDEEEEKEEERTIVIGGRMNFSTLTAVIREVKERLPTAQVSVAAPMPPASTSQQPASSPRPSRELISEFLRFVSRHRRVPESVSENSNDSASSETNEGVWVGEELEAVDAASPAAPLTPTSTVIKKFAKFLLMNGFTDDDDDDVNDDEGVLGSVAPPATDQIPTDENSTAPPPFVEGSSLPAARRLPDVSAATVYTTAEAALLEVALTDSLAAAAAWAVMADRDILVDTMDSNDDARASGVGVDGDDIDDDLEVIWNPPPRHLGSLAPPPPGWKLAPQYTAPYLAEKVEVPQLPPHYPPTDENGKVPGSWIIEHYTSVVENPDDLDDKCSICLGLFSRPFDADDDVPVFSATATAAIAAAAAVVVVRFLKCGHCFHRRCLEAMQVAESTNDNIKTRFRCPLCKTPMGRLPSVTPDGIFNYGLAMQKMNGTRDQAIVLEFKFPSEGGLQGPFNERPGTPFHVDFACMYAHLPNSIQGRYALQLVILAWEERLLFTVGMSDESGLPNHLVTNHLTIEDTRSFNAESLERLTRELKELGIDDDDLSARANTIQNSSKNATRGSFGSADQGIPTDDMTDLLKSLRDELRSVRQITNDASEQSTTRDATSRDRLRGARISSRAATATTTAATTTAATTSPAVESFSSNSRDFRRDHAADVGGPSVAATVSAFESFRRAEAELDQARFMAATMPPAPSLPLTPRDRTQRP